MIQVGMRFTGRAFRYLSAEVLGLHAAVYVLALSSLLSSLLALIRDRLLAHIFGASASLDVYYAGFQIADLIFVATGALVSVYILIPELARRNDTRQKDYIDTIVFAFSALAVLVSGIAALFAPQLLATFFPRFVEHGMLPEAVSMTRILLLQPIFMGLSNILAAITQARYRYTLYALSPLLYNMGIIFGITVLYPVIGLRGMAWGVVLGSVMHLFIQVPSIVSDGFLTRIPRLREPASIISTAIVSVPRALALSMNQVAYLGLTVIAGILPAGSIAIFKFGFSLQAVPLGIIGASYSVAAFPTLAAALSRGDREQFIEHVATAARYVFFWSIPATALILVLRAHIVRVILGSGNFDWTDTRLTAAAFALFSLSLAAQGLTLLLVRGYYAAGKSFVPFVVSIGITLVTLLLGAGSTLALKAQTFRHIVEVLMRVEDLPGSAVLALPASYAVASILGTFAMFLHFEYRFRGFAHKVTRSFWQSLLAAVAGGYGTHIFLELVSSFDVSSAALSIFGQGFAAGTFGLLIVALVYYIIGSREYGEVWASLHSRLWRREVRAVSAVAPAEETTPAL